MVVRTTGEGSDLPSPGDSVPAVNYEVWRSRVDAELRGQTAGQLRRTTPDEIELEPLYTREHLDIGLPLPRPAPSSRDWRIWQELTASAGTAGRAALARERDRGLAGVWLRLGHDGATAHGLAALLGDALATGEVDLAIEWAGEPMAGSAVMVAAILASARRVETLGGCLGCDPLGALARRGTISGNACEQLVGAARWTLANAPEMRAALVSTAHYAEAGADAVQEIGFALATGASALRSLLGVGIAPAEAVAQILLSLTVGRDLYLQVAKLRAMRLTWGMLLANVDAPPSATRLHARTAWRTKGRRDPGSDLVRATVETLAAVLGGADDITTSPLLDAEEELALGMALGSATQLLLREEVGLARVADAAGGSWYVESLTAQLARRGWELFEGIERRGGMARELAVGSIARQVAEAAERRRRALEEKKLPIVGVTLHPPKQPVPLPHRPLVVEAASSPRASDAGDAQATILLSGDPESPAFFAAAVEAAARGATAGAIAAAVAPGSAPLRAPTLHAWRDAEIFEPAEASA